MNKVLRNSWILSFNIEKKNYKKALAIVKIALKCYEPYAKDEGQSNSQASSYIPELYEKEILHMLTEIVKNVPNYNHDAENLLSKEHNAFIVRNTEKYYLGMIKKSSASWNIRDEQIVSTIVQLMKFHWKDAKIIVWKHNTHIGDARATDMASEGMVNVVQLLREQHVNYGVVATGFGSYKGSVVADREWADSIRKIKVPEAVEGRWKHDFYLNSNG